MNKPVSQPSKATLSSKSASVIKRKHEISDHISTQGIAMYPEDTAQKQSNATVHSSLFMPMEASQLPAKRRGININNTLCNTAQVALPVPTEKATHKNNGIESQDSILLGQSGTTSGVTHNVVRGREQHDSLGGLVSSALPSQVLSAGLSKVQHINGMSLPHRETVRSPSLRPSITGQNKPARAELNLLLRKTTEIECATHMSNGKAVSNSKSIPDWDTLKTQADSVHANILRTVEYPTRTLLDLKAADENRQANNNSMPIPSTIMVELTQSIKRLRERDELSCSRDSMASKLHAMELNPDSQTVRTEKSLGMGTSIILSLSNYGLKIARTNQRRAILDPYGSQARLSAGLGHSRILGKHVNVVPGQLSIYLDLERLHSSTSRNVHQYQPSSAILASNWRKDKSPAPIEEPRTRLKNCGSKSNAVLGLATWRLQSPPDTDNSVCKQNRGESPVLTPPLSAGITLGEILKSQESERTMQINSALATIVQSTYDSTIRPTKTCESILSVSSHVLVPSINNLVPVRPLEEGSPLWSPISTTTRVPLSSMLVGALSSESTAFDLVTPLQVQAGSLLGNQREVPHVKFGLCGRSLGTSQNSGLVDIHQRDNNRCWLDPLCPPEPKPPDPYYRGDVTWRVQFQRPIVLELLIQFAKRIGNNGLWAYSRGEPGNILSKREHCLKIRDAVSASYCFTGCL